MFKVSEILAPSEAHGNCATENSLALSLWRPVWRRTEAKRSHWIFTNTSTFPSSTVEGLPPLPGGEMQSRKQRLSPSLLATIRKQNKGWLPFFVTRALTALRLRGLAFPCQGIPAGNFKVGIKDWWMSSHFSQAVWRAILYVPVVFMQKN